MNKAYNKITWQNKPSTATPLNQTNLNEMSNALDTIDDRVIALDSGKVSSVTVTNTLPTGDTIATITVDGTATNIKAAQVEVDAEPSATSENPLQNKAIYEMLNEILPEETAEGNPISISDASGLNAKACSVDLLPIQDLHGYDSPWVGGAGKNKCNPSLLLDQVGWNTFTIQLKSNTQYTMSSNIPQSKTSELPLYFLSGSATPGSGTLVYSGNSITMTSNENGEVRVQQRRVSGTDSFQNYQWQIEEGSQQTLYAPYSNICPISGRTEVNLSVSGKNLLNPNGEILQAYVDEQGKIVGNVGNRTVIIPLLPNTTYVYKWNRVSLTSNSDNSRLSVFNHKPTVGETGRMVGTITTQGGTVTFTTTNETYVAIKYANTSNTDADSTLSSSQLELGTTATTYEPYQGETHTENLGQTVYGGKVDFVSGGLSNEWGYIASYNGETLPREWISDRDVYAPNTTPTNGAEVAYKLDTPIEITLTEEQISLLKGNNVVSTDGDNINLVYSADIKAWVENQLSNS